MCEKKQLLVLWYLIFGFWSASWCGGGQARKGISENILFLKKEAWGWEVLDSFKKLGREYINKRSLGQCFKAHIKYLHRLGLYAHETVDKIFFVLLDEAYADMMSLLDEEAYAETAISKEESLAESLVAEQNICEVDLQQVDNECPICTECYKASLREMSLGCGKILCFRCLRYLKKRKAKCPFCRSCSLSKATLATNDSTTAC